jgi:hypothetical protein
MEKQYLPTYKNNFIKDPRWLKKETEHYNFYYFPGSVAEQDIKHICDSQEKAFKKIISFLQVSFPNKKITYYFYPDPQTKKDLMGDDWYAQAIWGEFVVHVLYTKYIKPLGEHEDTHLLSLPWGLSISLFQEGLAEYLTGHGWHGEDQDELAREAFQKKVVPPLSVMMDHLAWRKLDNEYALYHYSFVGSFTKFLINKYGKEAFQKMYEQTSRNKSCKENSEIFFLVYGRSIDAVEQDWKNFLFK